ncbi:MAG: caspase domain-containing protein [Desulfobacterales bacterium]|jgi:uncharacterized caspase-like protein
MRKRIQILLYSMVLFWVTVLPPTIAQAAKRVALILGNSAYLHSTPLRNPVNDANSLAEAFTRLGFTVVHGIDQTKTGMDNQIRLFSKKLKGAKTAVFFYAGHGMQLNFKNYLIPIDFDPRADTNLISQLISLDKILHELEKKKRVSIVFLDACRDNPLANNLAAKLSSGRSLAIDKTRGVKVVGKGLAEVEGKAGTLIAYATQPGNVASDGDGKNSPFTESLLKYIEEPGLEIRDMMSYVRVRVMKKTDEKQIPWDHSSLVKKVYFKKKKGRFAPPP